MGRTMLMVVILMGSIYAGIMNSLQEKLLYIPEIITRNIVNKQAENISDFALRVAIRDGNDYRNAFLSETDTTSFSFTYTDNIPYVIQNSEIKKIDFIFKSMQIGSDEIVKNYTANSLVVSNLLGKTVNYPATVGYQIRVSKEYDEIYNNYYTMDNNCWKTLLEDESGNINDAIMVGHPKSNPHAAAGDRCAEFGGTGSTGADYLYYEGNDVKVGNTFSLLTWAKIPNDKTRYTLLWLPPDPDDPLNAEGNGIPFYQKPTGSIEYRTDGGQGKIYFTATTALGEELQITTNFTPTCKNQNLQNKGVWNHFAMSYDMGVLKAYMNGALIGTDTALLHPMRARYNTGFYVGSEKFPSGTNSSNYHYYIGYLDEVGFSPYTLEPDQLHNYYATIAQPAKILYFRD